MNASITPARLSCAAPNLRCARQPLPSRSAVKLLLIAALWLAAAPSIGAGSASTPAAGTHPISGKWAWTLPGKACTETLEYRSGGKRLGTSGDEATEAEFQITAMPSLLGFYRLTETLTVANGKRDCSGDLHAVGEERVTRFIQFSPKLDQMIVCKEESLKACFGPLKRVPG